MSLSPATPYDDATVESLVAGASDHRLGHAALARHLHADVTLAS